MPLLVRPGGQEDASRATFIARPRAGIGLKLTCYTIPSFKEPLPRKNSDFGKHSIAVACPGGYVAEFELQNQNPRIAQAKAFRFSSLCGALATAGKACLRAVATLPANRAHHAHLRCVSAAASCFIDVSSGPASGNL